MSAVLPAVAQVAGLAGLLTVSVPLLGRYLAHIYTSDRAPARRARRLPGPPRRPRRGPALARLPDVGAGLLAGRVAGPVRLRAAAAAAAARRSASPRCRADGAWNTAVSFVTNTNWQWYSGEAAAGHLIQMSGLDRAELRLAPPSGWRSPPRFARGLARTPRGRTRRQLLDRPGARRPPGPAAARAGRGGRCSSRSAWCRTCTARTRSPPSTGGTQHLTGGPVASQEAIKELGTNGGGFYNANSAHPFENPTPLTNLLEIYLLLRHPVRDDLRLRPDRRRPPPGLRGAGA